MSSTLTFVHDTVSGLSTSQVAALIAFGVFAVQLFFSFAWPLILVGFLNEKESAVTWSVAGRVLHNSYWPTVLRTDSTATTGVHRKVVAISYTVILASLLAGIAAIVTPLGLYEDIGPNKDATPVQFEYAVDKSAIGLGTPPRSNEYGFARICQGLLYPVQCPHSEVELIQNGTELKGTISAPDGYDTRIPKNVYEFFQGGLSRLSQTVSSLFDIQWRTYSVSRDDRDKFFQNGSEYLTGSYRQIVNVVLNDDYEAVEGLVVDTKNGGIGFRNHTIPAVPLQYGGEWTEDILFVEPVTECANMNITLDFALVSKSTTGSDVGNITLTDHGGFVDLNHSYPYYDPIGAQDDPELAYRAYKGAWMSNAWTMLWLNITNPSDEIPGQKAFSYLTSEKGQKHVLPSRNSSSGSISIKVDGLQTGPFLSYIDPSFLPSRDFTSGLISNSTDSTGMYLNMPPNPWSIANDNFTEIRSLCTGAKGGDKANITNVAGACGLVMAMPQREDGSNSVLFEKNTTWTTPLYNCASASRAIIKSVTFRINGSATLENLKIKSIAEKEYPNKDSQPLWAVENTKMNLSYVLPLWGLVEKEDESFGNISFKRSPHLWLSGYSSSSGFSSGLPTGSAENLPGVSFHSMALDVAYGVRGGNSPDYTGSTSLPLYNRWKNLTTTARGTATMINLIWTDIAANAVVGTRGNMPVPPPIGLAPSLTGKGKRKGKRAEPAASSSGAVFVPIHKFNRVVRYKYQYAIPAFLVLALVVGATALCVVALIFKRATPGRVRAFLVRLSAGRLMTATLAREEYAAAGMYGSSGDLSKKEKWLARMGRTEVDVSGKAPRLAGDMNGSTAYKEEAGMGETPMSSMLERRKGSPKGYI